MNFKQQLAKYVTGNFTTDQLPELGVAGLEEGLNTPSLRILAGLSKHEHPVEIDLYFKSALAELNIPLPTERQAAIEYALAIADEILSGAKDVINGTGEMICKAIDSYDFSAETKQYAYDSIGFEKAYGLFDTYDELSNADHPWQAEKTNEQLMAETKAELFQELLKWKNKMML